MRCDEAHVRLSLSLDGENGEHTEFDAHLASCPSCAAHGARLLRVRQQLRYEEVTSAIDIAPRVLAALGSRERRPRIRVLALVASFTASFVAGASFVGLGARRPGDVAAASIPARILHAQTVVASLHARLRVVERGWHRQVAVRAYEGSLDYSAPESLVLRLRDETRYPSGRWRRNDVDLVVDRSSAWWRGPAACPAELQPGCTPSRPRLRAFVGRDPFSEIAPAPLDLVVPVRSFGGAATPSTIGTRRISGRDAIGVSVSAAQVAPLLDGVRRAGNWREVHPADPVELWLDREVLVPLEAKVYPAPGEDREAWAARRGYNDRGGTAILEIRLDRVAVNEPLRPPKLGPDTPGVRDIGFRDDDEVDVPVPAALPDGMLPHRAGVVFGDPVSGAPTVTERSWTDGRAWLRIRATRDWSGGLLFGDLGRAVRVVPLGDGVAYVSGSRVAIHARDVDVVVDGSLAAAALLDVARSLGISGVPVPEGWDEAGSSDLSVVPLVPTGLGPPAVRVDGTTVTVVYAGPGDVALTLVESRGDVLAPPLDIDARGVLVRGLPGRYSPSRGELEWTERGLTVSITAPSFSLAELVKVAGTLR